MAKTAGSEHTSAAKQAFKLKWHRARMYEKGMSKAAVARKIAQMQSSGDLPKYPMIQGVPARSSSKPKRNFVERLVRGESGRSERVTRLIEARRANAGQRNDPDDVKPRPRPKRPVGRTRNGVALPYVSAANMRKAQTKDYSAAVKRRLAAQKKGKKAVA